MREFTNRLLDAMEMGSISANQVAEMALGYMAEDDVKDMCLSNDLFLDGYDE